MYGAFLQGIQPRVGAIWMDKLVRKACSGNASDHDLKVRNNPLVLLGLGICLWGIIHCCVVLGQFSSDEVGVSGPSALA